MIKACSRRVFRLSVSVPEQGHKFRPSNGTIGCAFIEDWCGTCARDEYRSYGKDPDGIDTRRCDIVERTMLYQIDDPEYPAEWTYDADENPCCTAYIPVGQPVPQVDDQTVDMFGGV